jgi:hypothetical protein
MRLAVRVVFVRWMLTGILSLLLLNFSSHAATLSGTVAAIPRNSVVDLTAAGALDWVHWGLHTDTSVDRKANVTPRISDFTLLPPASIETNAGTYAFQFSDNPNGYSWSDGSPTASVTNTTTGVWAYGFPISLGTGFELTVPADTQVKTLKLYVGAWAAQARLQATLSDDSAPAYVDITVNNMGVVPQRQDPSYVYTIEFAAASAGQSLRIRYSNIHFYHASGNVTLQSAALTTAGADSPPGVSLTGPAFNSKYAAGENITLTASAADPEGAVNRVEFFANDTRIGTDSSDPFSVIWDSAPAGYHVLTAIAYDEAGNVAGSLPIDIFVHGSGGTLSANLADPPAAVNLTLEGVNDWTHWGLVSSNSLDRKADVPARISALTVLGTEPLQQYSNNYTSFSWTDGTPTPSVSGTPTGVFLPGRQNGFRLTTPADATPRRLKVYVGLYGAKGNFQAYLTDFSAMAFTDTSLENIWSDSYAVFTIDYTAASPGQSLVVQYRSLDLYDFDFGNVTIQSATLVGNGGGNLSPIVSLITPTNGTVLTAPANITLQAVATDTDGSVTNVAFFNGTTKLGQDAANPYSFSWSNVPPGTYSLTAKATDDLGATAISSPANIIIRNPVTSFRISYVALTGGTVTFSFPTETYWKYTILRSSPLGSSTWETLRVLSGTGSEVTVSDQIQAPGSRQFYKVLAE